MLSNCFSKKNAWYANSEKQNLAKNTLTLSRSKEISEFIKRLHHYDNPFLKESHFGGEIFEKGF